MSKIENNHAIVYFHNFEGETIAILKTLEDFLCRIVFYI